MAPGYRRWIAISLASSCTPSPASIWLSSPRRICFGFAEMISCVNMAMRMYRCGWDGAVNTIWSYIPDRTSLRLSCCWIFWWIRCLLLMEGCFKCESAMSESGCAVNMWIWHRFLNIEWPRSKTTATWLAYYTFLTILWHSLANWLFHRFAIQIHYMAAEKEEGREGQIDFELQQYSRKTPEIWTAITTSWNNLSLYDQTTSTWCSSLISKWKRIDYWNWETKKSWNLRYSMIFQIRHSALASFL